MQMPMHHADENADAVADADADADAEAYENEAAPSADAGAYADAYESETANSDAKQYKLSSNGPKRNEAPLRESTIFNQKSLQKSTFVSQVKQNFYFEATFCWETKIMPYLAGF